MPGGLALEAVYMARLGHPRIVPASALLWAVQTYNSMVLLVVENWTGILSSLRPLVAKHYKNV